MGRRTELAGGRPRWAVALALSLVACAPPVEPRAATLAAVAAPPSSAPASSPPSSPPPEPPASPAVAAPPPAPQPEAEPPSARTVRVPGDRPVLVVEGGAEVPIIYLHGRCGDPTAFLAWAKAGRRFGTIVSFTGEVKCRDGVRTRWTEDIGRLDARITRALEAVRAELGLPLRVDRRIVVGYSQGALRAEALADRYPARYPRVVLAAGPRGPRTGSLRASEAILLLGGERDVRSHLVEAAADLERAHRRVRYLELPGARHGEYGPQAEQRLEEGLGWLTAPGGADRDPASPEGPGRPPS